MSYTLVEYLLGHINNSDNISKNNQSFLNRAIKMGIQNLADNILLIILPEQPHLGNEIDVASNIINDGCDRDVIIDFYQVKMLTSESVCSLMILERLLSGLERKLVLCNVPAEIKQIFKRTGLEPSFEFADDDFAAVQSIKNSSYLYD